MEIAFYRLDTYDNAQAAKDADALDTVHLSYDDYTGRQDAHEVASTVMQMAGTKDIAIAFLDDDGNIVRDDDARKVKTYRVTAVMRTYLETTIQATSLEEARRLADDIDGGDFTEQEGGKEWETFRDEIEEVTETAPAEATAETAGE